MLLSYNGILYEYSHRIRLSTTPQGAKQEGREVIVFYFYS